MLLAVLLLIAVRRVGPLHLKIWQIMTAGACLVLVTGAIGPMAALRAVDLNVMLFLFGMFVVGEALVASGYLNQLAASRLVSVRSTTGLVARILIAGAFASAFLMNDTVAIVGTPVVLDLAREHGLQPRLTLMALAFAVTIGSVFSPIGNPQNLLIAAHIVHRDPFSVFFTHLALPTLASLVLGFVALRWAFYREFRALPPRSGHPPGVRDRRLARLVRVSLLVGLALLAVRISSAVLGAGPRLPLSAIALMAAIPVLVGSPRRAELLRRMDWPTLTFFVAMFILMASVWRTGFLQEAVKAVGLNHSSLPAVLGLSLVGSQIISNVPLVALYLPMLDRVADPTLIYTALAAGSTIAGNALIMGAASNVIIVQSAESRGIHLSFFQFARVGIPLTLAQGAIYWLFLR